MKIRFGNRRIIGQQRAKQQVERILESERISHAYLISGPDGAGKTAFALAFAEAINGIDHLTDLAEYKSSKKSSWFTHPDIHMFIPMPTSAGVDELRERLELLAEDPYEIIDFSSRPSLNDDSSKNLQAFYPIDYFRDEIRPIAKLKPNEGNRIVIILTGVETMRKETANAFLKLLEEPSDRLMFILTTDSHESLLPTITSRCQHIPLGTLRDEEVKQGLMEVDGMNEEDASYLARVSNGNYSMTRFFDVDKLRKSRSQVVEFMRNAYSQEAGALSQMASDWQSDNNIEGLIALTNLIEMYIRDLMVYRATGNRSFITNVDQMDSIEKFTGALKHARLEEMIEHLDGFRPALRQYANPKIVFIVLALRFSSLMRGEDPVIPDDRNWEHLPAFVD